MNFVNIANLFANSDFTYSLKSLLLHCYHCRTHIIKSKQQNLTIKTHFCRASSIDNNTANSLSAHTDKHLTMMPTSKTPSTGRGEDGHKESGSCLEKRQQGRDQTPNPLRTISQTQSSQNQGKSRSTSHCFPLVQQSLPLMHWCHHTNTHSTRFCFQHPARTDTDTATLAQVSTGASTVNLLAWPRVTYPTTSSHPPGLQQYRQDPSIQGSPTTSATGGHSARTWTNQAAVVLRWIREPHSCAATATSRNPAPDESGGNGGQAGKGAVGGRTRRRT